MHEAIIAAPPPAEEVVAVKVVALPSPQFELPAPTEPGLEEHQVKKLPVITLFCVSVTVAVMFTLLDRATLTTSPAAPFPGARTMDSTRQVLKENGTLETPLALAVTVVVPGTLAVNCA